MLHDIGIIRCDAPGINVLVQNLIYVMVDWGQRCFRKEVFRVMPVSVNGIQEQVLPREQIINQHLPLPEQDFLPETMEEKVICYADKFFSKTHLDKEKTVEQAERSLAKFGEEGVLRFREWEQIFC